MRGFGSSTNVFENDIIAQRDVGGEGVTDVFELKNLVLNSWINDSQAALVPGSGDHFP